MEDTTLQEILNILKKRLLLIVSLTILGISIATVLSFYILTPVYQAQTQILINHKDDGEEVYSSSRIQLDLQLINTYNDIIKSPIILSEVIKVLQEDISLGTLANQISLSSNNGSKVMYIDVLNSNPELAVNIANTTAKVFQEKVSNDLLKVDNVNILSEANLDQTTNPVKPNKVFNIVVGAGMGIMIGIGLALLIEKLDSTIKDEKDIEENLGIPILGVVGSIPLEKVKTSTKFKSYKVRSN